MILNTFNYSAPHTLEEVVSHLNDDEVEILLDNHHMVRDLKKGIIKPKMVVSLRNITELNSITVQEGNLVIGATTPLSSLRRSAGIKSHTALFEAMSTIQDPHILHHSTIAGAFYHRSSATSALLSALTVLGAELYVWRPDGPRLIDASAYFEDNGNDNRTGKKFIQYIKIPGASHGTSTYQYVRYLNTDKIVCGVAAYIQPEGVDRIRIGMAVGNSRAYRLKSIEAIIENSEYSSEMIDFAFAELDPGALELNSDMALDKDYIRHISKVLVKRAMKKLLTA